MKNGKREKGKKKKLFSPPLTSFQLSLFQNLTALTEDENLLLHFWLSLLYRDSDSLITVNKAMTQYWTNDQYIAILSTVSSYLKPEEEVWLVALLKGY